MYRNFYGLKLKPFQISTDPAFLWHGEKHREALAVLKYGVMDNRGFLLLTGDVGTGKTTLIHTLVDSLGEDVVHATVPDPGLEKLDFFNYISSAFGMGRSFDSKGAFLVQFNVFLNRVYEEGRKVLLIVDEAQMLSQELLEEIRLLSNIERRDTKLLNIFFVGQNEFNRILTAPKNSAVRQRMTVNYNISPLDREETGAYVNHRLTVAGGPGPIFSEDALEAVYNFSKGYPRLINIVCDHALLSGYVKEMPVINGAVIDECADELSIPGDGAAEVPEGEEAPPAAGSGELSPEQPDTLAGALGREVGGPVRQSDPLWKKFLYAAMIVWLLLLSGYLLFPEVYHGVREAAEARFTFLSRGVARAPADAVALEPVSRPGRGDVPERESDAAKPEPGGAASGAAPRGPSAPSGEARDPMEDPGKIVMTVKPAVEETGPLASDFMGKNRVVVRFTRNSNEFVRETTERLDDLAVFLNLNPGAMIRVTGYTDSAGSEGYNRTLSRFRAGMVKSYLLGKGADYSQIETFGKGPDNPLESNDTAAGRRANRRVEVELVSH